MGWSSGCDIFDPVCKEVLKLNDDKTKKKILKALIGPLLDQDWATEQESEYFDVPLVRECFEELAPEGWYAG